MLTKTRSVPNRLYSLGRALCLSTNPPALLSEKDVLNKVSGTQTQVLSQHLFFISTTQNKPWPTCIQRSVRNYSVMSSLPLWNIWFLNTQFFSSSERARSGPGCRPETCLPFQTLLTHILVSQTQSAAFTLSFDLSALLLRNTKIRPQWSHHAASPTVVPDSVTSVMYFSLTLSPMHHLPCPDNALL